jgi:hypothetical protein
MSCVPVLQFRARMLPYPAIHVQGSATLEVPGAPGAAAGCQAALHFIHEETLGDCWDRRKRLCDDMYRGEQQLLCSCINLCESLG